MTDYFHLDLTNISASSKRSDSIVQQAENEIVDDGDFREPLHYSGSDTDEGNLNDHKQLTVINYINSNFYRHNKK